VWGETVEMAIRHLKHMNGHSRRGVTPSEWNKDHVNEQGISVNPIQSSPPEGRYKVVNLYVNPSNGKLVIEYDDGV